MSDQFTPTFGWVDDQIQVWKVVGEIENQGQKAMFADAAPNLMTEDDDAPVFMWDAEMKVLGEIQKSFNQGSIGSCVGAGYARGSQDLMLIQCAAGSTQYPGAGVAIEPIYGGSRVEVGGGQIGGDGSIGAWAAQWLNKWGVLLRKTYEAGGKQHDFTTYSIPRCRQYGNSGVPTELETIAREYPVTAVAMVRSAEEAWAAIGGGKPIPVCSNQGFTSNLVGGFCEPSGTWNHCMTIRGRFMHPQRGKCFVIQNSWGSYLSGDNVIPHVEGRGAVTLPEGCFATTFSVVDRMVKQQDSFALAGLKGWERERIDYTP